MPGKGKRRAGTTFYDLCVELRAGISKDEVARTSARLKELGYGTVAWNINVDGLAGVRGLDKTEKSRQALFQRTEREESEGIPWLRRVTVVVDNVNEAQFLKGSIRLLQKYDVVAVRPTTDAAMAFACESGDMDIISLDLTIRPPVQLNAKLVEKAVARGVLFEVRYAPLVEESGQKRQQLMSAVMSIFETLRGKNMILSSGARVMDPLRGPHDVANLAIVLGMKEEHAFAGLMTACELVVGHARARRLHWTPVEVEGLGKSGGGQAAPSQKDAAEDVPMEMG